MIKWIIFDAMGVVFEEGDDTKNLLVPFIKNSIIDITSEYIIEKYIEASLGNIKSSDFFKSIYKVSEDKIVKIEENYLANSFKLDKHFLNVAKSLKIKYKIGLLSNDVSEWSIFLRKFYNLEDIFDLCIISGDVKIRKPNKEIYTKFLSSAKVNGNECVYIDDRPKNLVEPLRLGMNAILLNRENIQDTQGYLSIRSLDKLEELIKGLD